jgi:hypothetical protein
MNHLFNMAKGLKYTLNIATLKEFFPNSFDKYSWDGFSSKNRLLARENETHSDLLKSAGE